MKVSRHTIATALVAVAALALTACGPETDNKPASPKPDYTIVSQKSSGASVEVVVEVGTTKGLRAVFDHVASNLTKEAGYFISINCSTGGTAKVDNRLANGRKAVGNKGVAATGMKDGEVEFEANKGRTCPAA
ncbi:hypothetical protein ACWD6R_03130 [Streptomyces sp. NPDC005151]